MVLSTVTVKLAVPVRPPSLTVSVIVVVPDWLEVGDRLAALQAVALLDTPTEQAFDRLSGLATFCVKAPVALV